MALTLFFMDSFAHYNDTAVKWSTGGGVFETTPAHVRTAPQSLRIQQGDSPGLTPVRGFNYFTVGTGWQTSVLAGEVIFELWEPSSVERQLFLVQNADGSISVWTGNDPAPTLIGTTVPGVLTVGPWWYIELTANLNPLFFPTQVILTITNAAGVATERLNVSGFTTSQSFCELFLWGGPVAPNHAWVADFYFAQWDRADSANYSAPHIYGFIQPVADGGAANPAPFNVSAAPYFPQVAAIPQNTASFISRDDTANPFAWPDPSQAFRFNMSAVPPGSAIAALQVVCMWQFEQANKIIDWSGFGAYAGYTGDPLISYQFGSARFRINPALTFPFVFPPPSVTPFFCYVTPFDVNPITGLPWVLAEFSGATPLLLGPDTQSLV